MEDIKEKTADEMFDDLGYEIDSDLPEYINTTTYTSRIYRIRKRCEKSETMLFKEICFFDNIKKFSMYANTDDFEIEEAEWTMEDLQAINKKCKEMNWI